nr:hypothetical protein [Tanacetum cinerariifolium]
ANPTWYGHVEPVVQNTIEKNFDPVISRINVGLHMFLKRLNEEMVADLRYFNSLESEYFEIHDLKSQLQDKSIAITELKKLIEKLKGKSVDTKIEQSSVIRQPNAFKSPRPSVLGKPTTFSNSFIRNDFSKSTSVTKNNVSNDFSKPVTAQTLPDSKKTNKSVSFSTGVISTTSVSRQQLKSNPKGDRVLRSNSHGKKLEVEEHRRNVKLLKNKMSVIACNDSLNVKTVNVTSVSAMCAKCVMIKKHDLCVPKSVAKPLRKTVASESIKKPRNNVRKLHERFGKIYKWTYIKFTPSGYMWKPKSKQVNVNPNVSLPLAHRDCPIHRRRTSQLPQDSRKTNKRGDRVMQNNSQGKKHEVEDHRRSVKLSKNKTSVTACNDSLNAKTLNVKSVSAMCDKCVLHYKHDMCVLKSVANTLKEIVASESKKKPRNFTKKIYERVSKTCSWWYPKFTPSGYIWKPKSGKENVNPNVSMPLGKASRTANVMDTMTSRCSIVSNTSLSSNAFAARRDCLIHRRLWVLKAHDGKSQAS